MPQIYPGLHLALTAAQRGHRRYDWQLSATLGPSGHNRKRPKDQLGKPPEAATKAGHLAALRTFFRDLQEWEEVPRRFDPQQALAIPRSIAAVLGPPSAKMPSAP